LSHRIWLDKEFKELDHFNREIRWATKFSRGSVKFANIIALFFGNFWQNRSFEYRWG
jgi:hypothetical protein